MKGLMRLNYTKTTTSGGLRGGGEAAEGPQPVRPSASAPVKNIRNETD